MKPHGNHSGLQLKVKLTLDISLSYSDHLNIELCSHSNDPPYLLKLGACVVLSSFNHPSRHVHTLLTGAEGPPAAGQNPPDTVAERAAHPAQVWEQTACSSRKQVSGGERRSAHGEKPISAD